MSVSFVVFPIWLHILCSLPLRRVACSVDGDTAHSWLWAPLNSACVVRAVHHRFVSTISSLRTKDEMIAECICRMPCQCRANDSRMHLHQHACRMPCLSNLHSCAVCSSDAKSSIEVSRILVWPELSILSVMWWRHVISKYWCRFGINCNLDWKSLEKILISFYESLLLANALRTRVVSVRSIDWFWDPIFRTNWDVRDVESFRGFWDLTEVCEQSWYKVLTYALVNPTFKTSLLPHLHCSKVARWCLQYIQNILYENKGCYIGDLASTALLLGHKSPLFKHCRDMGKWSE